MAGRDAHERRVLLTAVVAGFAVGIAFVVLDLIVDVLVLGEGPLAVSLREPAEAWMRSAAVALSVVASVAFARLLLANEGVAAASQRYRALAESARDDIFIVDRDRRISYMNSHAAEEFGQSPEALEGKSVPELFGNADVERMEADLRRAFEGEAVYSEMEFTFGGRTKWLSTRLVPLGVPDRRIESVLGISRDVTGAKREMALSNALTRISEVVHARLSVDEILNGVAAEAAGATGADSCMVLTCDDRGWTIRFAHGYPEDLLGTQLGTETAEMVESAISQRQPVCIGDTASDTRVSPDLVERFGIRSVLAVPLLTRRGVVGVLLFTHRSQPVCFTPDIVDFAGRVGSTASLAIDNARLYEEKHDLADSLQSAILMMPERVEGIDFAHVYHSATEAARVGGDFYDLFELEGDCVGITIGDISGHGIDAAVLTSLVKNGIRVEATQEDRPPAEVIGRASRLLFENSPPEIFATVFFGVLDRSDGTLQYCNAGHTTACIRRAEGEGAAPRLTPLPANSPMAGAFPGQRFQLSTEWIGGDDLLFLYTDGLTEARRDGELFGEERLFEVLARTRQADAAEAVRDVMAEVMSFAADRLRDDLAILSLRRTARGEDRPPVRYSGSARG